MLQDNNINCIIIEDELPATIVLEIHISKLPILNLVGKFSSTTMAMPVIHNQKIDLIFLDINLPGISGIDFANSLIPSPGIIFTTAYPEYAIEGFNLAAIDYLLKPISLERFTTAVNRYLNFNKHSKLFDDAPGVIHEKQFVFIKCERRMVKIFVDEILYLEAQRNYLLIYTEKEVYKAYQSISDMIEKLPEGMFIRTHRSFVISITNVEGYTCSHVLIKKKEIPIGRLYSKEAVGILKSMIE